MSGSRRTYIIYIIPFFFHKLANNRDDFCSFFLYILFVIYVLPKPNLSIYTYICHIRIRLKCIHKYNSNDRRDVCAVWVLALFCMKFGIHTYKYTPALIPYRVYDIIPRKLLRRRTRARQ